MQEFEKKFSETTQFKNLKKMLEGKNGQIKELRSRIKRYNSFFFIIGQLLRNDYVLGMTRSGLVIVEKSSSL